MKKVFSVCSGCGRIMTEPLKYKIVAKRYKIFNDFVDDGEYSYCRSCYVEITNKFNEQFLQATKKFDKFIKTLEVNISKGIDDE